MEGDFSEIFRMLAALAFVLALMGGLIVILRRLRPGGVMPPQGRRRLGLLETLVIDHQRRLVIIACDGRQHLVLLGPDSQTLIESGIESRQDAMKDSQ